MTEEKKATGQELHKKFAVELFNQVWDLLEKEDRSVEEDDRMVHAAHASRFHWGEIGTPLEFERGEWQVSRVYAVLKRPHGALYHGQRCLEDKCQSVSGILAAIGCHFENLAASTRGQNRCLR